jgi:hypothetical protein
MVFIGHLLASQTLTNGGTAAFRIIEFVLNILKLIDFCHTQKEPRT